MTSSRRSFWAALALVATGTACGVSPTGLGPVPDGSTGGASGAPVCPAGLIELASWPAKTTATSCLRTCGPDDIGTETCRQIDRAECQKHSGCLCLQAPCVACDGCRFLLLPDCYVPTNASTATLCSSAVGAGEGCDPACGRRLCLREDGQTACLCNRSGQYACADWDGTGWR